MPPSTIDTTHSGDHGIGNGYRGIASGAHERRIERVSLHDDGTRLKHVFELTDPE